MQWGVESGSILHRRGRAELQSPLWSNAFVLFAPGGWAGTSAEGVRVHATFEQEWEEEGTFSNSRWSLSCFVGRNVEEKMAISGSRSGWDQIL